MHSNKYIAPVKVPRKRKKQSKDAVPVKEIMPFVWHMYEQNQELVRENERLRCELEKQHSYIPGTAEIVEETNGIDSDKEDGDND
ncbi:MAG: hypothetical protein ACLRUR_01785 [Butyricicoccus pullicaecorum]